MAKRKVTAAASQKKRWAKNGEPNLPPGFGGFLPGIAKVRVLQGEVESCAIKVIALQAENERLETENTKLKNEMKDSAIRESVMFVALSDSQSARDKLLRMLVDGMAKNAERD